MYDSGDEGVGDEGFNLSSEGGGFEIVAPDGTFLRGNPFMESVIFHESPAETFYETFYVGELTADDTTAAGNPGRRVH